jgi:hypothetical protein
MYGALVSDLHQSSTLLVREVAEQGDIPVDIGSVLLYIPGEGYYHLYAI